jgi:predicted DNA-binding protein (MmcQ/YjbR family)
MEAEELIKYCLSKEGAYLDFPFGDIPVCVKVRKKIFAEIYSDPNNYKITLKCEPMLADFYRQQYPGIVVRGYHCPPVQQPHRNTVYVDKLDSEVLLDMIDHSYEQVIKSLPKKIQKELTESENLF